MKTMGIGFRKTKLTIVAVMLVLFICFVSFSDRTSRTTSASSVGPAASHTNAPGEANCTACHLGIPLNSGGGSVSVSGLPANYKPGQQYTLTLTTERPGGVIFGFQVTALNSRNLQAGTFSTVTTSPQQTQIVTGVVGGNQRRYVEHTGDGVTPTQFDTKSWTMRWTAPQTRVGKITFYAAGNAANSDGTNGGDYIYTSTAATLSGSAVSNFDTDTKSDFAVYRPSNGIWYSLSSRDGSFVGYQFGLSTDVIAPGDYDADGKTDVAVFRPSNGFWYVNRSTLGLLIIPFGTQGDIPVVGDYDGDLKSDIAVWRPSTGVWWILRSSDSSVISREWGLATDKIAQGDYDGDGLTDIAVWRPSNGIWYIWRSSDNGRTYQSFGTQGDKPVQGDYDGDGLTDFAVFRPSSGVWYLLRSTSGFGAVQWGISTDVPVPGDYDGDGYTDMAVYRSGVWYALKSSDSTMYAGQFGIATDIPVASGIIAQ